jgi:hypothetical protein
MYVDSKEVDEALRVCSQVWAGPNTTSKSSHPIKMLSRLARHGGMMTTDPESWFAGINNHVFLNSTANTRTMSCMYSNTIEKIPENDFQNLLYFAYFSFICSSFMCSSFMASRKSSRIGWPCTQSHHPWRTREQSPFWHSLHYRCRGRHFDQRQWQSHHG